MKKQITESIKIPEGVSCNLDNNLLICKKGSKETSKNLHIPGVEIKIKDSTIIFSCKSGNKNEFKAIKANIAHIKNLFLGLDKEYVYQLESCNVHFPMTLKVDGNTLIINNFLGEKTPRKAKILSGSKVDIKGNKIVVSSSSKDTAGLTVANIEKATKIKSRDRRVFQDGIYLVSRPGAED